jgi:hypothetical protein
MSKFLRLLTLLPTAALALDLTPQPDVKELEGVKIPVLRFTHVNRGVTWSPPPDWRMSFEEGRLLFLPKERTHASFEMRVLLRASGDTELLAKTDALQRYIGAFLPKTATAVAITGGNEGPFTIGTFSAREFLFNFQEPGTRLAARSAWWI